MLNPKVLLSDSIFGGAYGSEEKIDWRRSMIFYKKGRIISIKLILNGNKLKSCDMEQRYYQAAETRNNLVAASQNLQGAHGFLPNIAFPYCAEEEVDTLNKTLAIVTDGKCPIGYGVGGRWKGYVTVRMAQLAEKLVAEYSL
ncbi:uncharacterized protein CEXT_527801 [Caerostris extrusa]|uniref:Uncharacterized protein n=1 Tax=Caerostris extrusa TaxID=172846 RepID=A0AAV4XUU8_CAEEX|nr:uncharacterized protein CEXT_527801 [Caerostris extrusa]